MYFLKVIKKNVAILFFAIIAFVLLFQTINQDVKKHEYSGQSSVMSADAGGYYIYLPMWFIYGTNVENFPDSLEFFQGQGFTLQHGKVETKYTSGLAILITPFFSVAHKTAAVLGYAANGFTRPYHLAIRFAAFFYFFISLILLYKILRRYASVFVSLLGIYLVIFATNANYYLIKAPGFTHIYSFSLITALIFFLVKYEEKKSQLNFILLAAISVFIVAIRPINIIAIFIIPLWNSKNINSVYINFLQRILNKYFIFSGIIFIILIFYPQLSYWKYLSGHWIFDSYKNEKFSNWYQPQLHKLWFSSSNGLFVFVPLFFIFIAGIIYMIRKNMQNIFTVLFIFLLLSYICAAWWNPQWGCAFGQRNFLDFTSLFFIPIIIYLNKILNDKKIKSKILLLVFLFFCIMYTYNLGRKWYYCYFGNGDWDYIEIIDIATS